MMIWWVVVCKDFTPLLADEGGMNQLQDTHQRFLGVTFDT